MPGRRCSSQTRATCSSSGRSQSRAPARIWPRIHGLQRRTWDAAWVSDPRATTELCDNEGVPARPSPMTDLALPAVNPRLLEQATQLLVKPAALEFRNLADVLSDIHIHHVDHADLYFQFSRLESWNLEEGIVKSGAFSI